MAIVDTIFVREMYTGSKSTSEAALKTGRRHQGRPHWRKRYDDLYIAYLTDSGGADALTCKLYLDGSGTASKTITFAAQTSLTTILKLLNLEGRDIVIELLSNGDDLAIDHMVFDGEYIRKLP